MYYQSPCIPTVLSITLYTNLLPHNHPVYQLYCQSPCIPIVLPHNHPVCQLTITITLHINLLSHNHPVYQPTITLYSNFTITQAPNSGNTRTVWQFGGCTVVATVTKMTCHDLSYLPDCTRLSLRVTEQLHYKRKIIHFGMWCHSSDRTQKSSIPIKQYKATVLPAASFPTSFLPSFLLWNSTLLKVAFVTDLKLPPATQ
jgi:hypothetical protein